MILSTWLQGADDLGKHTHRPLTNVWVSWPSSQTLPPVSGTRVGML